MPATPVTRSHLTFKELMERWDCSENDLRDYVINGHIVPSIFVKRAIEDVAKDSNGTWRRTGPAAFVSDWMYVVGVTVTAPLDCAFAFIAREPDAVAKGAAVFAFCGNSMVDSRTRLCDVLEQGAFMMVEVIRAESLSEKLKEEAINGWNTPKPQWWNIEHDPLTLAKDIEIKWKSEGRGVNQSGARAGEFALSALSEAVVAEIEKVERRQGRGRTIGAKTMSNYLKTKGWQ